MDSATIAESVEYIFDRIKKGVFTQHVVVNVAKIVNMYSDKSLKQSVQSCDIVNIDGMGVVWGARFLGHDVPERVAGIDLFERLIGRAEIDGYSVYLLGAKEDVLEKALERIIEQFPNLHIAGYHHGYFWDNEAEVVDKIKRSGAQLLFVAITSPKKENFIQRWKEQLGVTFVMGVGGTFDVVAGKVNRAPLWMQKYGLEWLYRIIQEPKRMWKRYLVTNSKFAYLLLKEKFF